VAKFRAAAVPKLKRGCSPLRLTSGVAVSITDTKPPPEER
jgi:hypothetical protein